MTPMADEPQSPLYRWADTYTRQQWGLSLNQYVTKRRREAASWSLIAFNLADLPGGGPTGETLRQWFGKDPK